jgi:hypothetical protein
LNRERKGGDIDMKEIKERMKMTKDEDRRNDSSLNLKGFLPVV